MITRKTISYEAMTFLAYKNTAFSILSKFDAY